MTRYRDDYRLNEISLALSHAATGNSLGFVGIAGTGKSNIVQVLRDDMAYKRRVIGERADTLLVATVNAVIWDGAPASLWGIMNDALLATVERHGVSLPSDNIRALSDTEDRTRRRLGSNINWLCRQRKYRLLFILDDFDHVFAMGPLSMLETLSAFRDDGNRELLSYLVMTKKLPHILGREYDLAQKSKFYDLFRNRIYGLGVYSEDDALQMIQHLNETHRRPLDPVDCNYLQWLAGGHARLIRIIFDAWNETPPTSRRSYDLVQQFADREDVRQECCRILKGLHAHERNMIRLLATGNRTETEGDLADYFQTRGLVLSAKPLIWFSPLFGTLIEKLGGDCK